MDRESEALRLVQLSLPKPLLVRGSLEDIILGQAGSDRQKGKGHRRGVQYIRPT